MVTNSEAAALGLLVVYMMDMHVSDRASLAPKPDARLLPGWKLTGYLTGDDCLFRCGRTADQGDAVCYGFVAESLSEPGQFVAVIRGTDGIIEWAEDAQFNSVPHASGGRVEAGFWGIYNSLRYRPLTGGPVSPVLGLAKEVGNGSLTIIGHSLGGPIATYLTYDLAKLLPKQTSMLVFASPRPGNAAFAQAFESRVPQYQVFNYELDVVPRVPFGPDYSPLKRVTWLSPVNVQARIAFDLGCHHHVVCYAALLDYAAADWPNMPAADRECAACIKGRIA